MTRTAGSATEQVVNASPGTFEEFFRAEHARLLRALYLVTGSADEAQEVAQDAVRVWERWDRVRGMDDPTGYLFRTAMNVHRSTLRRARRAMGRAVHPGGGSRDAFADAEDRDEVSRALRGLAPRQRAALVLTELLGYDSEEAGRILRVKAVTVRVLASQGRTALRSTMEHDDE